MEAPSRPLPRLPRPVAAAGLGTVLLGVPVVVTLGPHIGSSPAAHAVLAANEGQRNAAADALRTAAAFRAEERTSRNRAVPSAPATACRGDAGQGPEAGPPRHVHPPVRAEAESDAESDAQTDAETGAETDTQADSPSG